MRSDPTRLKTQRRRLRTDISKRIRLLKSEVKARLTEVTLTSEGIEQFHQWLQSRSRQLFLGSDWWTEGLSESYGKGAVTSFREANRGKLSDPDAIKQAEREFMIQIASMQSSVPPNELALNQALPRVSGLTAKPLSATRAQLAWGAVRSASRYLVERNGVVVGQTRKNEFRDTGLLPGIQYRYRVRADNREGESPWSPAVIIRTGKEILTIGGVALTAEAVRRLIQRFQREEEGIVDDVPRKVTSTIEDALRARERGDETVSGINVPELTPSDRRRIAIEIDEVLEREEHRMDRIVETGVTRAHADGQLDGLDRLGIESVSVEAEVEWRTMNDDRVCPLCRPLEGKIFKVDEARGLIPRHPFCRCRFVMIPDPDSRTERQRLATKAAARRSALAEVPAEGPTGRKRKIKTRLRKSRWPGIRKRIRKSKPEN